MPYDHRTVEPKWQAALERRAAAQDHLRPGQAQVLRPGHVPLPLGRGAARRALRGLHRHRHHHPLEADAGLERAAPDGLGRLRPARRELRHQDRRPPARSPPRRRSPTSAGRSTRSASPTTGIARSTPPTRRYFKWTQWIFLQLYKQGPGLRGHRRPSTGARRARPAWPTRRSARAAASAAGRQVERKDMRQWLLRITRYADRLLEDLAEVDWPESTLAMQRNWIGRSEGAEVVFQVADAAGSRPRRDPGVHHPAGHAVRRDLHGAGARAPAGGQADHARPGGGGGGLPGRGRARRATSSAPIWPRTRPGRSPAATPSTRSTARRSRSGSPTTC